MLLLGAVFLGAFCIFLGVLLGVAIVEIRRDPSSRAKEISDAHIRSLRDLGDDHR
jgi:hypothetical protein